MDDELIGFVREALTKGQSRDSIRDKLLEARWPEDDVATALDAFADVEFPIPVPRPKPYLSAKDAFLYLVLFSTLYLTGVGVVTLLFAFIHEAFPDPAAPGLPVAEIARWWTASLLIGFPLFLWLSRRTYLVIRRDPEKRTSKVRKWLTYLTLFVAAGVILGDLITLVYYLLGGGVTWRFVLKVLSVGTVAGAVFGFYLWDLKQDDRDPASRLARHRGVRAFTAAVVVLVATCIVGGLLLAGSPGLARSVQLDQVRLWDLRAIADAMDSYVEDNGRLPGSLEELSLERGVVLRSLEDPETNRLYGYRTAGGLSYELCAVFDGDYQPTPGQHWERFWQHGAGRNCFPLEAEAEDD